MIRTADKQRVARKDGLAGGILKVVADAVLRVARRVHGLDRDVANLERLAVLRHPGDGLAVPAANDGELAGAQLGLLDTKSATLLLLLLLYTRVHATYQLLVAARMVPVAMT